MTPIELRKTVKTITTFPLFSSKWFAMLGNLHQITENAVSEHQAIETASQGASSATPGAEESLQTLWERNELTVSHFSLRAAH